MRRPRISTTPKYPPKQTQSGQTNPSDKLSHLDCQSLLPQPNPRISLLRRIGFVPQKHGGGLPSSPLAPVDQERPTRPRSAAKSPRGRGIPAPTGLDAEALAEPDRDEAEFDETPLLCTANVAPTTQKRAPNGFSWAFQAHANGFHHCRPSAIMPLCQRSAPTLPQISAQVQHNYRLPIDQHMSFRRPIVAALYERRSLVLSVISVTTSRCRPRALTRRFVL